MDYLTYINRTAELNHYYDSIRFLVSGDDPLIHAKALDYILTGSYQHNKPVIMINNMGQLDDPQNTIFSNPGYELKDGLSGNFCIYNPFSNVNKIVGMSRFREMLRSLGFDQASIAKTISYLHFIEHLEILKTGKDTVDLSIELLSRYCTTLSVTHTLDQLFRQGIITDDYHSILTAKYSECSDAAADLETYFYYLLPFTKLDAPSICTEPNEMVVFNLYNLDGDDTLRSMILHLIKCRIKEDMQKEVTLLVLDQGSGDRKCIYDFIKTIPHEIDMHIISMDIFTICNDNDLPHLFNQFNARIYGRHSAEKSCQMIETSCGSIDVRRITRTTNYDRRFGANKPWDVLFGKNKTESYAELPPVQEPRYRKEMIQKMGSGSGIVEFMGNFSQFHPY